MRNTLMGNTISDRNARDLQLAFRPGAGIDDYINESGEPTPETRLLDALVSFADVDMNGAVVPMQARVHILNGSYIV